MDGRGAVRAGAHDVVAHQHYFPYWRGREKDSRVLIACGKRGNELLIGAEQRGLNHSRGWSINAGHHSQNRRGMPCT